MQSNLTKLLAWGPPKRLTTKFGERILRIAPATDQFRRIWKLNKEALKAAGLLWERKIEEFTGNITW
jgi:hypothetical protein